MTSPIETGVRIHYGLTVVNPTRCAKFVEPPPPTPMELVRDALREFWLIAFPLFLVACSVTAFRIAFGLL